jgi:hypothetical protein
MESSKEAVSCKKLRELGCRSSFEGDAVEFWRGQSNDIGKKWQERNLTVQ